MAGQAAATLPQTRLLVETLTRHEAEAVRAAGALAFGKEAPGDPALLLCRAEPGDLSHETLARWPSGATILIDTAPLRLVDRVGFPELEAIAQRLRARDCALALGGSLEVPDLPRLLPLNPAFLLLAGELRDASGALDLDLLRDYTSALFGGTRTPHHPVPDRVFIRDFVQEMEVGAYRSEKGRRQRVRFCVEAELAPVRGPRAMGDVYSYDRMMDAVRALAERVPEAFVETLAERLAAEILADPRVQAVTVKVEKLDLGPGAAGVEIHRRRD